MTISREKALVCLDTVFRVVLGAVFIYAAWSKLYDPALFASSVSAYRMLPDPLVAFVAIVLPPAEFIAGAALIFTKWQRESALLILGMLAMFFIGLVQAEVRGLEIGCGCFGGKEGDTVIDAIVRDVFLLIPAVWLVVRRNRPAWNWKVLAAAGAATAVALAFVPLQPHSAVKQADSQKADAEAPATKPKKEPRHQKTPEEAVAEIVAQFPAPDTNSVSVEAWTSDFPAALARARAEKRPLLMVVGSKSCKYCQRLRKALANPGFEKWTKGTGMYLASANFATTNHPPAGEAMSMFLKDSPGDPTENGFPYVGVYWENPSGEIVWTAFTGRHGEMRAMVRQSLACELANSLNEILADYLAGKPPRPSEGEMLATSAKRIKVAAEGEGQVSMKPAHGTLLDNGSRVIAEARPAKGWKFVGWKAPSGKIVRSRLDTKKLAVSYSMQGGTYTAVFKRNAAKKPPQPKPQTSNGEKTM